METYAVRIITKGKTISIRRAVVVTDDKEKILGLLNEMPLTRLGPNDRFEVTGVYGPNTATRIF